MQTLAQFSLLCWERKPRAINKKLEDTQDIHSPGPRPIPTYDTHEIAYGELEGPGEFQK